MTALQAAGLVFRRDGPPTAWPTLTWGLTSELANYGQPETLSPAAQRLSDARHAENAAEKKVARLKAELLAAQEESTEATARVVDAQDALDLLDEIEGMFENGAKDAAYLEGLAHLDDSRD